MKTDSQENGQKVGLERTKKEKLLLEKLEDSSVVDLVGWKQLPKMKQELDSWRSFSNSLRLEDREVFKDMISKIWEYADAIENSERGYTTESLLISMILSQQKTIDWMAQQLASLKAKKDEETK